MWLIKSVYSSKFFLLMVIGALVCSLVGGFLNFLLLAVGVKLCFALCKTISLLPTNQDKGVYSW